MMQEKKIITAVLVDEYETYSIQMVCEQLNIPESLMIEMEEHGLFQYEGSQHITHQALKRIESACRIHQDLGVNLPGVVLALELLEELEELRHRLSILERGSQ
jgi:chaperone modulatory protein CbpM